MEVIINHLNILNKFFVEHPKAILSVGQTDSGNWLVGDNDIEVAGFVVIRYMIKNNYKFIGQINIYCNGNNYSLYAR